MYCTRADNRRMLWRKVYTKKFTKKVKTKNEKILQNEKIVDKVKCKRKLRNIFRRRVYDKEERDRKVNLCEEEKLYS